MQLKALEVRPNDYSELEHVLSGAAPDLLFRESRDVVQNALDVLAVMPNRIVDKAPHGISAREVVFPVPANNLEGREINQDPVRDRLRARIGEDTVTEGFVTHNETATASRCVSLVRPYRHSAVLAIFA